MRNPWFGPKRFGIGVSPKSWQGWISTLVFILAFVGMHRVFSTDTIWLWIGRLGVAILFGAVIYVTYERDDFRDFRD